MQIKYNAQDLKNHHGVAVVIVADNEILLMDHVKFNFWTIPVGKVDAGQEVIDGLKMEMKEELGIDVVDCEEINVNTKVYNRNGIEVEVIQHIFLIKEYTGNIVNNEPDKHRHITWVRLQDVRRIGDLSHATMKYLELIGM